MTTPTVPAIDAAVASRDGAWTQSKLKDFEGCPRMYALTYEAKLPTGEKPSTAVGTAYHWAWEVSETRRLQGEEPMLLDEFHVVAAMRLERLLEDVSQAAHDAAGTTIEGLKEKLWNACEAAYEYPLPYGPYEGQSLTEMVWQWTPLALEQSVRMQVVDGVDPIQITVDGVYENEDGEVVLADHKTANSPTYYRKDGSDKMTQIGLYSAVAVMSEVIPVDELPTFHLLVGGKKVGKRSRNSRQRTRHVAAQASLFEVADIGQRLRAAQQSVEAEWFPTDPTYKWCEYCPFFQECQVEQKLNGSWPDVLSTLQQEGRLPQAA